MVYCHSCGSEIQDESKFCPECGANQRITKNSHESADVAHTTSSLAGRTGTNALIGGTVGFLVGLFVAAVFTPLYVFGILVGGALGGYLQNRGGSSGAKVGSLAGLIATAPIVLLLLFGAIIGLGGLAMSALGHFTPGIGGFGLMGIVFLFGFILILSTVTNVLFGALGGIVGAAIAEEA